MSIVTSWGNYPYFSQASHTTYWREDIAHDFDQLIHRYQTTLAFGNGRSYGDSCLATSANVINMSSLNRFMSVDWEKGVIIAEAGITLGDILEFSIPHGWFLPVTPGTQYVTLGGAIANDVHGKNHHIRGTFGCHVKRFELLRSDQTAKICSATENTELFSATISGLGMTGIITWVELQLMPIQSQYINTRTIPFENLNEFFLLSKTFDMKHEYTVAWVDCLAKGEQLGRGVFFMGDHADNGPIETNKKKKISIPFTPPKSMVNALTLKILNTVYYRCHTAATQTVHYEPFFYPLDRILQWNRLYGNKGFQQYQCIIPEAQAESAMHTLLEVIGKSGQGSFLAVMKKCGKIISPGLLSFPMPGISLALDFPQNDSLNMLFSALDHIVRDAGGRLYPAKDAHMSGEDFRQYYPKWEQLSALRDPALCSHFWKRVTEV